MSRMKMVLVKWYIVFMEHFCPVQQLQTYSMLFILDCDYFWLVSCSFLLSVFFFFNFWKVPIWSVLRKWLWKLFSGMNMGNSKILSSDCLEKWNCGSTRFWSNEIRLLVVFQFLFLEIHGTFMNFGFLNFTFWKGLKMYYQCADNFICWFLLLF